MKKLIPFLFAVLSIVFLGSCTTKRTISVTEDRYKGIEVFSAKIPDKNFQEIKLIQVQGKWPNGPKSLMNKLVRRAKNQGANGLINVQYSTVQGVNTISGTAVKFEESN
jgi:uncharacterized protein YbjQ (UPF0145 family)